MKSSEFTQKVEKLNHAIRYRVCFEEVGVVIRAKVDPPVKREVEKKGQFILESPVVSISDRHVGAFDTRIHKFYDLPNSQKLELLNLVMEYATTPIAERLDSHGSDYGVSMFKEAGFDVQRQDERLVVLRRYDYIGEMTTVTQTVTIDKHLKEAVYESKGKRESDIDRLVHMWNKEYGW